jgi:hypothetical protein
MKQNLRVEINEIENSLAKLAKRKKEKTQMNNWRRKDKGVHSLYSYSI